MCIYGKQRISIVIMDEVKSKVATQFKILERNEKIVQKYLREKKTVEYKIILVISKND